MCKVSHSSTVLRLFLPNIGHRRSLNGLQILRSLILIYTISVSSLHVSFSLGRIKSLNLPQKSIQAEIVMLPEGRVSGWDIFKASIERFDPNFSCVKSSAVNASVMSLMGATVGFLLTSNVRRGCLLGAGATFATVLIGSHCSCVYRKQIKLLKDAENESS